MAEVYAVHQAAIRSIRLEIGVSKSMERVRPRRSADRGGCDAPGAQPLAEELRTKLVSKDSWFQTK